MGSHHLLLFEFDYLQLFGFKFMINVKLLAHQANE